jgi:hypothetical protein
MSGKALWITTQLQWQYSRHQWHYLLWLFHDCEYRQGGRAQDEYLLIAKFLTILSLPWYTRCTPIPATCTAVTSRIAHTVHAQCCLFTHSTMHVHTQYHARSHTVPCMFTHSTMHAHTQCHACSHTVPCMFTHSAMYCCHQMAQYVRVLTVKQLPKFLSFLTACEVNCLNC